MAQHFKLTGEVAEQLQLSKVYVLRIAELANIELDTVGEYKAWTAENIQKVREITGKRQPRDIVAE